MDVRQPDIFKFITMKHDKTKVTGANVSVKINDDFMHCVQNDSDYTLQWPIDSANPKYSVTVKARDLFEEIVSSATTTAEPGVLFWDTVLKRLPAQCYADVGFNHTSTNPCSELPLSEDSCRLISINLKHFVKNPFSEAAFFDKELFQDVVRVATRLSDDLVEIELEKLDVLISVSDSDDEKELYNRFKKSCAAGRRTG
jgi:ribonucleoside-diphosphate reductase alpha chain